MRRAVRCKARDGAGVTLVEAMIALAVLAVGVTGTMHAINAAASQSGRCAGRLEQIRLAEDLLEEVGAQAFAPSGVGRCCWGVLGFDGFSEPAGGLVDAAGRPYPDRAQRFTRSVSVSAHTEALPIVGVSVTGALVRISVTESAGSEYTLEAFVVERTP